MPTVDTFLQQAAQKRAEDFSAVRDWVWTQVEKEGPHFVHTLSCLLCESEGGNDDTADLETIEGLRHKLKQALLLQTATIELADHLRQQADEEPEAQSDFSPI